MSRSVEAALSCSISLEAMGQGCGSPRVKGATCTIGCVRAWQDRLGVYLPKLKVMASLLESFLDAPGYVEHSPWFPNPAICIRDMALTGTKETVQRLPLKGLGLWLNETWYWVSRAQYNDPSAILMPLLLALLLTILRWSLNAIVFRVSVFFFGVQCSAKHSFSPILADTEMGQHDCRGC